MKSFILEHVLISDIAINTVNALKLHDTSCYVIPGNSNAVLTNNSYNNRVNTFTGRLRKL